MPENVDNLLYYTVFGAVRNVDFPALNRNVFKSLGAALCCSISIDALPSPNYLLH